jgi:hypothetical protein
MERLARQIVCAGNPMVGLSRWFVATGARRRAEFVSLAGELAVHLSLEGKTNPTDLSKERQAGTDPSTKKEDGKELLPFTLLRDALTAEISLSSRDKVLDAVIPGDTQQPGKSSYLGGGPAAGETFFAVTTTTHELRPEVEMVSTTRDDFAETRDNAQSPYEAMPVDVDVVSPFEQKAQITPARAQLQPWVPEPHEALAIKLPGTVSPAPPSEDSDQISNRVLPNDDATERVLSMIEAAE